MSSLQGDEEVIIVDANSNDGTQEYLATLTRHHTNLRITSEPDRNQAHGWNKAILQAQGRYIKKIIDDDVYDYRAIRCCLDWLDSHPDCDVMTSNDMGMTLGESDSVTFMSRLSRYELWASGEIPSFPFSDMHIILRRSSLPLLGLYDTSFVNMDYEYSLRISYVRAGIAYYTGCLGMNIRSPITITSNISKETHRLEGIRANTMYQFAGYGSEISSWSWFKLLIGRTLTKLRNHYFPATGDPSIPTLQDAAEMENFYTLAYQKLIEHNLDSAPEILFLPAGH